jgi:hypothetical protein
LGSVARVEPFVAVPASVIAERLKEWQRGKQVAWEQKNAHVT